MSPEVSPEDGPSRGGHAQEDNIAVVHRCIHQTQPREWLSVSLRIAIIAFAGVARFVKVQSVARSGEISSGLHGAAED